MSSILLLLEDGEMHPFVPGQSGGHIILTQRDGSGSPPSLTYTVDGDNLTLGSHFLTSDGLDGIKDEEGTVVTKLEVENVPMEVVVQRSGHSKKKQRKHLHSESQQLLDSSLDGNSTERKVCLWPTGNGTTCGKTFTKFDSLKRHLSEAHKGLRPFACTLCDKTYGRRDYLQRHLKSHNNSYAVNLAGSSSSSGNVSSGGAHVISHVVKKVHHHQQHHQHHQQHHHHQQHQQHQHNQTSIVLVQQPQSISSGNVQIMQSSPQGRSAHNTSSDSLHAPNTLPFFSLSGQLPTAKPMGSKICRWVQNDGTVCGKAFSKLDSLRRHVNELHKGVRPHNCNLCDKSYGRRDYLDRHMRTHEKKAAKAASASSAVVSADGAIDWGPNSGVLLSGDELPPAPKIPKKKRKDIPPEEKKICLWILEDGTACGKTFTKFDSLKRHVSEAHKQIRPYTCSLCGKNYGRRDYLLRHLRSHNDIEISNITIQKIANNPSNHPANNMASLNTSSSSTASSTESNSGLPSINFSQMLPQPPQQVLSGIVTSPNPPLRIASGSGSGAGSGSSKRKSLEEKKTCKWVLDNGTVCGKMFSKFDSLRRHVAELHKNIRPFICELCQKTYGRKDYLDRHLRSHMVEGTKMEDEDGNIITMDGVIDADDIETTTTTVVVDTGEPDEEIALPNVVTVVSNDDV